MAHHTQKTAYAQLTGRLNRGPQGAPPSETLYKILAMMFTEREAGLVALLPVKPFSALDASRVWKMDLAGAQKVLDDLADRAILVDAQVNGETVYVLPPPMAGFFEFSMMRLRTDVDQKVLGELFYQYMNVEEDFVKSLFYDGETRLGRTFVQEGVLSNENAVYVLDYERASEVIRTSSHRGIGMCYCRHKMMHVGKACDAPLEDICMTFGGTADSLIRHEYAREIDVSEGLDLLAKAWDHGLLQLGENVRKDVSFICNCCGCCCEALVAARRFGSLTPVHTTNFLPEVSLTECNGCGLCVTACPVEAMTLVSANDPHKPNRKQAKLNEEICLGCGVCVRACKKSALSLKSRPERVITPLNSVHRMVVMAVERGTFQDLLFDNKVLWSHRALAAVLGVILRMPPIQRAAASRQMKSRYLEALVVKLGYG